MSLECFYQNLQGVMQTDNIFSENTHLVASNRAFKFNFHYVRQASEELNDSVIQINLIDEFDNVLEFYVNNIEINVRLTGLRIFDTDNNNKLVRFVLGGECSSLYIYNTFAILE